MAISEVLSAKPRRRARVLFVADSTRGHAAQRVRGSAYGPFFERDGWSATFADCARDSERDLVELARSHDAVVLLKVASLPLVRYLGERADARLVFDFCDALWSPARRRSGWADLDRILASVDAVFGENSFVCDYARRHNPRVFLVPDSAQVERFDEVRSLPRARRPEDGVRVGWVGSRNTSGALEKIRRPLGNLAARHPGLEVRVLGVPAAEAGRVLAGIRHTVLPAYGEGEMIRELLAMDIGVFPAPADFEDYCGRGPLKALLYMGAGLPAVCQAGGECSRILQDGVTGMLAETPADWERKLEALILSPELRLRMGEAALERVRAGYTMAQTHATLRDALLEVLEAPRNPGRTGLRGEPPLPFSPRWTAWTRRLRFRARRVLRNLKGLAP